MQELLEDQAIIYTRNGEELTRITRDTCLIDPIAGYVRCYQPFTEPGNDLSIPIVERDTVKRTRARDVTHDGNVLTIETNHSTYTIEYVNIDLEKMLADGQGKGVNDSSHPIFPHT
ncbi:hypothetical protein KY333_02435 [Candidatus Woesearchaeota archaeon]|nr:hypothetical protein [Candidatus Woesearchaeota archaeon]